MAVQIETVSTEQANYLFTHLNLEEIQTILHGQEANIPLSQIQGMEAENLINFLVICFSNNKIFLILRTFFTLKIIGIFLTDH